MDTPLPFDDLPHAESAVAVVGGGFAGLMVLARLAGLDPGRRITLFERRPRSGPGVAYGACDPHHLLNVPAGRMGASPETPGAFHAWLEAREPGRYAADAFVPRALFGQYLRETLEGVRAAADVRLVGDAVVHVEPLARGYELLLASGRTVLAGAVVLAPGLPAARAPWRTVDTGAPRACLVPDPWEPHALDALAPDACVVVVGSGLTAIDVVLGLRRRGHAGKTVLVSRGGRLPLPHAASHGAPPSLDPDALARGPRAALTVLRRLARERVAAGETWQGAIDAVRPHAAATWQAWSDADRALFLRRLRPFWEIHRHRAPAPLLERLEAERAEGRLEIVAGTLVGLEAGDTGGALVRVREASGAVRPISAARVVNCAGPAMGVAETLDPLLGSLLRLGLASTDSLGLGLRADSEGRLIGADGVARPGLHLVGALRRGDLWESTAVPELRTQAARTAELLARA